MIFADTNGIKTTTLPDLVSLLIASTLQKGGMDM